MSTSFGKYKIIGEVARGSMGIIYKAIDVSLNRIVAVKQLILKHADPQKKAACRERFQREARLAAGLKHPNLVSVLDVCISADNSYFVMEFLEGRSLRDLLKHCPGQKISSEKFLPIFRQSCAGLSYVHEKSLVHRDIKPDNIFILADGKVKITDFGVAKSSSTNNWQQLTQPGVMLGTVAYSSPEQLKDARNVDHRADICSLGVVAYEALSGRVPFLDRGLAGTLMAIVSQEANLANEINPEISPGIAFAIAKAMRKKSSDRHSSVAEFEREIYGEFTQPISSLV